MCAPPPHAFPRLRANAFRACLAAAAALLLAVPDALAQAAAPPSPYNVSWAALDPGNDWAAAVVRSMFPIPGLAPSPSTGQAATVVSLIVGQFTGFVAAIAAAFVCYATIVNIHRAAETSRILGTGQSWIFVVRVGFAAVMMFPVGSGFSAGQALVMQGAMAGVGMARTVYQNAVRAVGPDAITIVLPTVPGTAQIVAGLIENELCMNIVNLAANATGGAPLVPVPQPMQGPSAGPDAGSYVTWRYALSVGNGRGAPACGAVTLRTPAQNQGRVAGVPVDMAAVQRSVLNDVLGGTIRPAVAQVAQNFWNTRQSSALAPLQGLYQNAVAAYNGALAAQAQSISQQLNQAVQSNAAALRSGDGDPFPGQTRQSQLGWAAAGAYYLEIAKLNAATLSLLTNTPEVSAPTYDGFGYWLARDVLPFAAAARDFTGQMMTIAQTADGTLQPSGSSNSLADARVPDGASLLTRVFNSVNLTGPFTAAVARFLLPTNSGTPWTDPFGGLMNLGQLLMNTSLVGFALAGFLSSPTLATGSAIANFLLGNWGGAAASAAGGTVMQFLSTPVFLLLLAILVPGITISYVLPMVPWVMWMAGVTGWIILVCEAMIAVPLWMLAHMTFGGDGLHGRASAGYALLFNVVFRPVLMVIGLFLGYGVFAASSWLIRMTFGTAAGFALANGWIVTNVIGMTVLLWIFVMAHVVAAMTSFRLVALLPHHLPRLIGFASAGRVDVDDFAHRAATQPGLTLAAGTQDALRQGIANRGGADRVTSTTRNLLSAPGRGGNPGGPAGGTPAGGSPRPSGSGPMDSTLSATSNLGGSEARDV